MKKSDLKDGMVVEQRNKERFLVFGERIVQFGGYNSLERYKDDLSNANYASFDIVKIYKAKGYAWGIESIFDDENLELVWERKEPVKLTQLQHSLLYGMAYDYNWIARDGDGSLYFYEDKPDKRPHSWDTTTGNTIIFPAPLDSFDFVKGEDSEPTNIQELLDNCEVI